MFNAKTILAPAAVAAMALTAAIPAQAHDTSSYNQRSETRDQRQDDYRYQSQRQTAQRQTSIRYEIRDLYSDINRAQARHRISSREAAGLRAKTRQVERLYTSYAHNGLSQSELRKLNYRIDNVRVALHMERRDSDGRRG